MNADVRPRTLRLEPWAAQAARWPATGNVLLAHSHGTFVVYQAFTPGIGRPAAARGQFGWEFSRDRMTWIKPNFLWMMHRSSWGTAVNQETVLAIHLRPGAFEAFLAGAVPSSFRRSWHATEAEWRAAVAASDVRLQWDPDWSPTDTRQERRALQLGLRGPAVLAYLDAIVHIEDITPFVHAQHAHVREGRLDRLETPREEPYVVADAAVAERVGLSKPTTP